MPNHHVNNFPPGTYVEHVDKTWVGTVQRITVNPHGEPILLVDTASIYKGLVIDDTVRIHPNNVRRLDEGTLVQDEIDEDV